MKTDHTHAHARFTVILVLQDAPDDMIVTTSIHLPSTKGLSEKDLEEVIRASPALKAAGIVQTVMEKLSEANAERRKRKARDQ